MAAGVANPLPARATAADHEGVLRRRAWLLTLGPIGVAALAHVLVVRGFLEPGAGSGEGPGAQPGTDLGAGLGWPLLGGLPLFVFGMWLLTATTSRMAVYVALAAAGSAVGSSFETLVKASPEAVTWSVFPLLNTVGLIANALASVGFLLMLAAFPDGTMEHRWQRVATRFMWLSVLAGPVTLLTSRHLVPPPYTGLSEAIRNPYAVESLGWAAPVVEALATQWVIPVVIGMTVFASRILSGGPEVRRRLRFMAWAIAAALVAFPLWTLVPVLHLEGTLIGWIVQAAVFASMIAIPVAGIHGILRHGAFDIAAGDRERVVIRSSSMLIAIFFGIAVAAPGLLVLHRTSPLGAVILTSLTAVLLLPLRGRLETAVRRAVLGDHARQLALLRDLGRRLENAADPSAFLTRLAESVRDGLDASWVRIRLVTSADDPVDSPSGVAGEPTNDAAVTHHLTEDGHPVGLLEVGPRHHGAYSLTERDVLRTVAGQATTALANVRLSAQLADQLAELTASRVRLVAAQDEERRRLERNLHDGIQQSVVALIAGLRLSRNRLGRGQLTDVDLADLQDQARETLADLRELAHGIHPQVLTDNGLVSAVESRTTRYPIPLTIEASAEVRRQRWSPDIEAIAFYTVRESLANVAKHSGATHAAVAVSTSPGSLRVEVCDDGNGFDALGHNGSPGGLANIRDRVGAVGGCVTVTSTPGSGTRLTVDLPVDLPIEHAREEARA